VQHNKQQLEISDVTQSGNAPTITDVWRLVVEIRNRLEFVERQQLEHITAFAVNDLNKPDYDGHRRSHTELKKSKEILDSYKQDATKKVISIVVVFLIGALSSGVLSKLVELLK
jgi:hypothetical protein